MEIYSFIHTKDLLQMWRSLYNMQPNAIAVAAATKLTKKKRELSHYLQIRYHGFILSPALFANASNNACRGNH